MTEISLDKSAIKNNWDFLQSYFPRQVKISAVVKGNAYGHGIETYVPFAEECGVSHFSVFDAEEAYKVHRVAKKSTAIMIMGAMADEDISWAVANDVEFYVFEKSRLLKAINEAERQGKRAIVHIEVETGMYRTGFEEKDMDMVISTLEKNKDFLTFRGLCMHFAGAEHISNYVRLRKQKAAFRKVLKQFKASGVEPEIIHTCCSAASLRLPEMHYDMVRIGIMQYGFWPSQELKVEYLTKKEFEDGDVVSSPLHRVINWTSNVMSTKIVPKGAYIGYGYSFLAKRNMEIATIPVGYSHGFSRGLSNSGIVLLKGQLLPVVGIVNMNCIVVDITDVPGVSIGDKVILIGEENNKEISVASFGEMINELNYELLTRLPNEIKRKLVESI
ncbi:MAG: alanine racemase [Flavipsychrobacter sp.]